MIKYHISKGDRFGSWVATGDPFSSNSGRKVQCRCACGYTADVQVQDLAKGKSTRCRWCRARSGCQVQHGNSRRGQVTTEYHIWQNMRRRCEEESFPQFKDYGGRGISVCERWSRFESFLGDMGRRPTRSHTLERIDNEAGYGPDNCRWATRTEQARNTRRNLMITIGDDTRCLAEWCEQSGINYLTAWNRLKRGADPREAIFGRTKCA